MKGIIYIMHMLGTNYRKVGYSQDRDGALTRVADLQTGNPLPLILEGWGEGDLDDEFFIHQSLAAYHVRGEWFEASEKKVAQAVKRRTANFLEI